MNTVVSRTFASTPQRDAADTWRVIVDLLCTASEADVKDELLLVQGIVASIISDQAPKNSAIIVTCDGPRTRIYCTYDEDAIDGTDLNESPLSFDPLKGDWADHRECHIGGDFLLIYQIEDDSVVFTRAGTHADLFGE